MAKKVLEIYLACSFAYEDKNLTNERKDTMKEIQDYLESPEFANKYSLDKVNVYNPSTLKIKNAWDYSFWDWGNLVFEADRDHVNEADLIVFVSYGKENNAGSVWETGYAYSKNIPVILVSMNPDSPESLMVVHSAHACIDGISGLKQYDFNSMPKTRIERVES